NPDVLSTFDGVRWGFACKVLNSPTFSPLTMFERLSDGIEQIEKSPAQVGCVVLNFKNVIDHNRTWPIRNPREVKAGHDPEFGAWKWKHRDRPVEILVACAEEWQEEFERV